MSNVQFLREALNAQRKYRGEAPLSGGEFLKVAREQAGALGMDMDMLKRPVNVGFSGGEKKRNEMVQMGIIDPALAILDETDSGLDIDALRTVGDGINRIMRKPDKAVLLITHYQRLLDYVKPDFVHVLAGGRIVRSGGPELALELEREGYTVYVEDQNAFKLEGQTAIITGGMRADYFTTAVRTGGPGMGGFGPGMGGFGPGFGGLGGPGFGGHGFGGPGGPG